MKRYRNLSQEDRETFDPWSVYSDLYCGLLLVFVLLFFFAIYRYLSIAETNQRDTLELQRQMQSEQQTVLAIYKADIEAQEAELKRKNEELDRQSSVIAITLADIEDREKLLSTNELKLKNQEKVIQEQTQQLDTQAQDLADKQSLLDTQAQELADKQSLLDTQAQELADKQSLLDTQAQELADQQSLLSSQSLKLSQQEKTISDQQVLLQNQARQIEEIVGVRGDLIRSLNQHLQANGIQVLADSETGAITFESSLLFEVNNTTLKSDGEAFIREFFPLYMDVLMRPEYREYVAEIIVEGHTDAAGSYLYNLKLSQQRALTVVSYCLDEENGFMSEEGLEALRTLIAANGKSYSNPILDENGEVDAEQSRRVEIKFRLKDQEMVKALDEILTENGVFNDE